MLQPAHAPELINTTARMGCPEGTLKYVHLPPMHCQGHMRVPAGLTGGGEWRACEREGRTNLFFILSNLKLSPFVGGRETEKDTDQSSGHFQGKSGRKREEGGGGKTDRKRRRETRKFWNRLFIHHLPQPQEGKGARNSKVERDDHR